MEAVKKAIGLKKSPKKSELYRLTNPTYIDEYFEFNGVVARVFSTTGIVEKLNHAIKTDKAWDGKSVWTNGEEKLEIKGYHKAEDNTYPLKRGDELCWATPERGDADYATRTSGMYQRESIETINSEIYTNMLTLVGFGSAERFSVPYVDGDGLTRKTLTWLAPPLGASTDDPAILTHTGEGISGGINWRQGHEIEVVTDVQIEVKDRKLNVTLTTNKITCITSGSPEEKKKTFSLAPEKVEFDETNHVAICTLTINTNDMYEIEIERGEHTLKEDTWHYETNETHVKTNRCDYSIEDTGATVSNKCLYGEIYSEKHDGYDEAIKYDRFDSYPVSMQTNFTILVRSQGNGPTHDPLYDWYDTTGGHIGVKTCEGCGGDYCDIELRHCTYDSLSASKTEYSATCSICGRQVRCPRIERGEKGDYGKRYLDRESHAEYLCCEVDGRAVRCTPAINIEAHEFESSEPGFERYCAKCDTIVPEEDDVIHIYDDVKDGEYRGGSPFWPQRPSKVIAH